MSGIVNNLGAVSGVVGTTVGQPAHTETNAANVGAGVLPVGVTGGSGLTALGTVATGNLSNANIVYPTGFVIQVKSVYENTTMGVGADDGTSTTIATTVMSMTVPDDHYVYMQAGGGKTYMSSGSTTQYRTQCQIVYRKDGSNPTVATNYSGVQGSHYHILGGLAGGSAAIGMTVHSPGFVAGTYRNESGSTETIKWTWNVYGAGAPGNWTGNEYNAVSLFSAVYK